MTKLNAWRMVGVVVVLSIATTITAQAQTFTSLFSFDLTDGSFPDFMTLAQGLDGNLYGTTSEGGDLKCGGGYGCGTLFSLTTTGEEMTLHGFCIHENCPDGSYPFAGPILASDGAFYRTTKTGGASQCCGSEGGGTVFKVIGVGAVKTIYSFCLETGCPDGAAPISRLIQASDGNLYGTTSSGGVNGGAGTVFRVTPQGALTTLHSY